MILKELNRIRQFRANKFTKSIEMKYSSQEQRNMISDSNQWSNQVDYFKWINIVV